MKERNSIISAYSFLGLAGKHFSITPGKSETYICNTQNDYNPYPSFIHEGMQNSYITYDMETSLQINLLDCNPHHITSVTADENTEVYYENNTSRETETFTLRRQNFYQITFLLDGTADLLMEKENISFSPLSACLCAPDVLQAENRENRCTFLHIGFHREILDDLQKLLSNKETILHGFFHSSKTQYILLQPVEESREQIMYLLFHMYREMLEKQPYYLSAAEIDLGRILASFDNSSFFQAAVKTIPSSPSRTVFEQTLDYIHAEKRKLSRKDLADHLHYNGNYISRVFQQYAGISMADYIRNVSLAHAAFLLLHSSLSVQRIMSSIGYENKTAFYNNFEQIYGVTPVGYRKRNNAKC